MMHYAIERPLSKRTEFEPRTR